jgi:hypothetical protein
MMVLFLLPSISQAEIPSVPTKIETAAEKTVGDDTAQPKFIWGIVLKFAATKAFEMLSEWSAKKMFNNMMQSLSLHRNAAISAPGSATLMVVRKDTTPIIPNITDSAPSTPMAVENGKENYQGALLALLVLQADGETLKVRPASEGFKSGEKFRIRIGATFDSELSLDNIDPQGMRSRLYPAQEEQIVKIISGSAVVLPLDKDSFFQFDDVAGEEKLVISLRDPRARGNAVELSTVHRQENEQGTALLQEVAAGKYAAIAEAISLNHR